MKPVQERREMVEKDNKMISVRRQSGLFDLNRSGLYYTPIPESEENLEIMRILDKQYLEAPYYGVEKLLIMLILKGYRINHKRLRRLLKIVNWKTIYPQKRTTISDSSKYKYSYLLKDIKINRPNQVWAIDITYIPIRKGFMYLFAIIDVYSRYVVGWSLSNTMTADWCVNTIKDAISEYGKPEIINSDQGSQFTSDEYINTLKEFQINISMDGKGRALDNIFIERLWRSVKYEHVYLYAYENGQELWNGLSDYFEFYNQKRIHQSLDYQIPKEVYFGTIQERKTA